MTRPPRGRPLGQFTPIALLTDGRPPVSKRMVLYLLSLLLLVGVAVGWLSQL